jgi:proprotein convertase subtilisin/kexin type 5
MYSRKNLCVKVTTTGTTGPYQVVKDTVSYARYCYEENCKVCKFTSSTDLKCDVCMDGFRKKETTETAPTLCVACPSNCMTCTSPSTCTECLPGFFLDNSNGACVTCLGIGKYQYVETNVKKCKTPGILNCETYASDTKCSVCEFTQECELFVSKISSMTPDHCIECDINDGFFRMAGSCYQCDINCHVCAGKDTCMKCKDSFYLTKSGRCESCMSNCKTCDDAFKCTKCDEAKNYYLSLPKGEACTLCSSATGKFRVETSPKACWSCPSNCITCTDGQTCTICEDGWYLKGGLCLECDKNCSCCTDINTCTGCQAGFYFRTEVNDKGITIKYCATCPDGFFKLNNDCFPCNANCVTCTELCSCTKFKEGFYGVEPEQTCPANMGSCAQCPGANHCTECKAGYILSNVNSIETCILKCDMDGYFLNRECNECYPCTTNCRLCLSFSKCMSCQPGYTLNTDGTCSSCNVVGCTECSKVGVCDWCDCNDERPELPAKSRCVSCQTKSWLQTNNMYLPANSKKIINFTHKKYLLIN